MAIYIENITVISNHGLWEFYPITGEVTKRQRYPFNREETEYVWIHKFDIEEWKKTYNKECPDTIDILDIGYWYSENVTDLESKWEYEESCKD